VEFLAAMTEGSIIRLTDLPPYILADTTEPAGSVDDEAEETHQKLRPAVRALERSMIRNVLAQTGSTYKAAKILGVSQSTVVRKAQQLGIAMTE